jgi:hypothetical protein
VLHNSLKAHRPITVRLLNYRGDGTPFVNDLTVMPIVDRTTNTTSHFLGVLRDRPMPETQRQPLPNAEGVADGLGAAAVQQQMEQQASAEAVAAAAAAVAAQQQQQQQQRMQQPLAVGSDVGSTFMHNGAQLHIPTQLQEALQVRSFARALQRRHVVLVLPLPLHRVPGPRVAAARRVDRRALSCAVVACAVLCSTRCRTRS